MRKVDYKASRTGFDPRFVVRYICSRVSGNLCKYVYLLSRTHKTSFTYFETGSISVKWQLVSKNELPLSFYLTWNLTLLNIIFLLSVSISAKNLANWDHDQNWICRFSLNFFRRRGVASPFSQLKKLLAITISKQTVKFLFTFLVL